MNHRQLLRSPVTNESYQTVLSTITGLASIRESAYVCICNVHMLIEAYFDSAFNQILNDAIIITPDGKPLSVFMNLLYKTSQERIAGPDLMVDLFERAAKENLSLFFYGATLDVLDALHEKLKQDYPQLHVAGMISPPFRALSEEEDEAIVKQINDSGAQMVFVALGCPKQEKWMHAHQGKIQAVMIGVGAAFPFYTGHLKRAPLWMQNYSLEWLYRLYKEPVRLFRRYFITNSLFLLLITGQFIQNRLFKPGQFADQN